MTARWDRLPEGAKVKRSPRRPTQRATYRCCGVRGCGELLVDVTYPVAERHADTHGGARLEMVTDDPDEE